MKIPELPVQSEYPIDNPDVDDAALDYIESEVGRFNLVRNWEHHKKDPNLHEKVKKWLKYFDYAHVTPKEVIDFIDKFIKDVHRGQNYL